MITDSILNFIFLFVSQLARLISLFGDVVPNPSISAAFATMNGYYAALNEYLPLDTIMAIIAFELIFEAAMLAYKLLKWAWSKIPGVT